MRQTVNNFLGMFLAILMAVMTVDVLWGVFTRYALSNQASWTEELARFLLIWIGILGAAYASGQKMHLAIDLISEKLSIRNEQSLSTFIRLLVAAFAFCILVVGGTRLVYLTQTLGQKSPALQIPMSFIYVVLPLSGLLIVYYKLDEVFSNSKST